MKKPLEFISALFAIILNNSFYLYGIYLLAILSQTADSSASKEYLISTGIVLTSWGILNVFAGGIFQLGSLIETGGIESYLSKPCSPLFLVAISKSSLVSLGEILQGIATIMLAAYLYDWSFGIKMILTSLILTFAFAAVVIIIGSLSFYSSRGSQLSQVLLQVILSLSLFPIEKALKGREKWILYATPLLMTATLPRAAILDGHPITFAIFVAVTFIFFIGSVFLFNYSLARYKAKNYISLNE